jgi:hypothetical protein
MVSPGRTETFWGRCPEFGVSVSPSKVKDRRTETKGQTLENKMPRHASQGHRATRLTLPFLDFRFLIFCPFSYWFSGVGLVRFGRFQVWLRLWIQGSTGSPVLPEILPMISKISQIDTFAMNGSKKEYRECRNVDLMFELYSWFRKFSSQSVVSMQPCCEPPTYHIGNSASHSGPASCLNQRTPHW